MSRRCASLERKPVIAVLLTTAVSLPWAAAVRAQSGAEGEGARGRTVVTAAGNDEVAWLILTTPSDPPYRGWQNRFAWQTPGGAAFKAAAVEPDIGRIKRWAAAGAALHVFFDDGTHFSYRPTERRVEVNIPSRAVPEAVTGVTGGDTRLYAIVPRAIGQLVLAQRATTTSAPASQSMPDGEAVGAPEADDSADRARDLIVYERTGWRHVARLRPLDDGMPPRRIWLCASNEEVHLLWHAGDEPREVHHASWNGTAWSEPDGFPLDGTLSDGTAMLVENRLVFLCAVSDAEVGTRWNVWHRLDGWKRKAPIRFGETEETDAAPPPHLSATAFGQNILLATVRPDGRIETGIWPAEGGAARRGFQATTAFDPPPKPLVDPQTREWANLLIVVGLVLLVWWRRQSSLITTAALPAGLRLANHGRRVAAILIDLAPALTLTAWLWYTPAMEYSEALRSLNDWQNAPVPPPPALLVIGWAAAVVLHAAYCALFECLWGATPGKRMLGCRVCDETGRRAGVRQILVRNAVRILELGPYFQIWPLLLMVFFTRNRQRLGDLLARTIVTERDPQASDDSPHLDETA